MKRIVIVGLFCFFVSAETFATKQCEQMYELSHAIMQMRQWGTPITEQMATLDRMEKSASKDKGVIKLLDFYRLVVVGAYKEPRFDTKEYQDKISVDFANNMAATCYGIPPNKAP